MGRLTIESSLHRSLVLYSELRLNIDLDILSYLLSTLMLSNPTMCKDSLSTKVCLLEILLLVHHLGHLRCKNLLLNIEGRIPKIDHTKVYCISNCNSRTELLL